MGPLFSVLAALVALTLAQSGVSLGEPRPEALLLGLALPQVVGRLAERASLRGQAQRAQRLERILAGSGWVSYALLVLVADWLGTVRSWTGLPVDLDAWPNAGLVLAMAPCVLFELSVIVASARVHGGTAAMRRDLRRLQLRMFLACCAPIALFVLVSILVGQSQWLRTEVQYVGLASFLFTVAMVAGFTVLLPRLLTWSWDTQPFPAGPRREALDLVAARAGFVPGRLLVWRTGDLLANAAIVGFRERGRAVLFSDHLLSLLNTRELGAVYAHEIGHARCRHVGAFIAWLCAVLFLGEVLFRELLDGQTVWLQAGVGLLILGLWYVGFGWLSRRSELEADLFSVEVQGDLPALVSALERVGGRLRDVGSWRHFSAARRVAFLERALADEGFRDAFKRRLRRLRAAGYALAVVGLIAQVSTLMADLPRDRTVVRLARGEYAAAEAALGGLAGVDAEDVGPLVRLAGTLPGPSPDAASRALDAALSERRLEDSLLFARVADLRGVSDAGLVVDALELAVAGDLGGALEAVDGRDGALPEALRRAITPQE